MSEFKNLRPVLKWTGGKRRLLEVIAKHYPKDMETKENYIEPFVGSGAVFFDLYKKYKIKKAYLFDANPELIMLYITIKEKVDDLIKELGKLSDDFYSKDEEARKNIYYEKREEYNNLPVFENPKEKNAKDYLKKSSLMIFLNKTCFTGLFRVGEDAKFRVPFGKYNMPVILNENNLKNVSKVFQIAHIEQKDFSQALKYANKKTFVYYDPPYRPASTRLNLKSSVNLFGDKSHENLKDVFDEISKIGAKQLITTADPTSISDDDFFDVLYKNYNIKREDKNFEDEYGLARELIITNY